METYGYCEGEVVETVRAVRIGKLWELSKTAWTSDWERGGSRVRSRRRGSRRRGLEQDAEGRGKNEKKYEDDGDGQR